MRPGLFRLDANRSASGVLASVPGLWARIESTLLGICEVAIGLRNLHGKSFALDDRFMQVFVGEYLVSYILDLEIPRARVMRVEHRPSSQIPLSLPRDQSPPRQGTTPGKQLRGTCLLQHTRARRW